ncbi:MGMT family protein [Lederbergia sp. NSJ-179]|uniref:MGMT family protein n=1 Tax=Lederbergia sp. NSJ-179 TaxID=2931402 RepID=UPI001FD0A389|nr:MGMT family protein [Lederbergia sp. NSJ-179]MCJ7840139.1 MGMT family protein [Lederbergia sp. NSJ-179]
MQPYTEQVISMIKRIPTGYVATYGQIARLAGNPRGARQVARILHSMSRKHGLPWHRVINAKGEIAVGDPETAFTQAALLEEEGVELSKENKINLGHYQWDPKDMGSEWMEG